MAFKLKVTYVDGRVEEVLPNPLARITAERHYGGLTPANVQEATIYMAWSHLNKAGNVTVDFDQWLGQLADAEEIQVKDVDPTRSAQPTEPSSGSASEPESPSTL
jgi:hypothetical protein